MEGDVVQGKDKGHQHRALGRRLKILRSPMKISDTGSVRSPMLGGRHRLMNHLEGAAEPIDDCASKRG